MLIKEASLVSLKHIHNSISLSRKKKTTAARQFKCLAYLEPGYCLLWSCIKILDKKNLLNNGLILSYSSGLNSTTVKKITVEEPARSRVWGKLRLDKLSSFSVQDASKRYRIQARGTVSKQDVCYNVRVGQPFQLT